MGKTKIDRDVAVRMFRENEASGKDTYENIRSIARHFNATTNGVKLCLKKLGIIGKPSGPSSNGHMLILDFQGHEDALDRIRTLAHADLRTPEQQAIYLLKWMTEEIEVNDKAVKKLLVEAEEKLREET